ncbi:MAG: immune inhibitor A [Spirochaetes bacterium]|nr:immune inhibitor A [Spirochaetota bacterium]
MKKMFTLLSSLLIAVIILAGCSMAGSQKSSSNSTSNQETGNHDAMFARYGMTQSQFIARYGDTLDYGAEIRAQEADSDFQAKIEAQIKELAENYNAAIAETESSDSSDFTFDGGTKTFLAYDGVNGYYLKDYTMRALGDNIEIWVANDLAYPDDRETPVITQAQVDTMRDEFDNTIYPIDTDFFGNPHSHTGANATLDDILELPADYYQPADGIERVIMLVDNVRDEQYYDPTYPFYIAGFYSSTFEGYMDRNIINIDTNKWEERLESHYFGTTAHELQHLIHDDNDHMEELWVDEGMADFAEYLCGYGHPWGHVNFFIDHPENSLVEWDEHADAETGPETLADYGQAYLLQLYFNDHFGKDFIKTLAQSELHGINGINAILEEFNIDVDFEEIFRRFSLALIMDSYRPGRGIYEFTSIDVKVNFESALDYDKTGVPAWGGDYKEIPNAHNIIGMKFDGIDFMPTPWQVATDPLGSDESVLWGNTGHEISNQIILEADLTGLSTATLTFDNYIDIEESWDFGFVEISLDNGETWISLANANTRDDIVDEGYPAIQEKLPGFTGHYTEWTNEEFDLSPYCGNKILICFNYMTDWGYNDTGWYIDNIAIPEIGFSDDCATLDNFRSIDEIKEVYVEYAISFVNERKSRSGSDFDADLDDEIEKCFGPFDRRSPYRVINIDPFNIDEASLFIFTRLMRRGNTYMVIWYAAPEGKKGSVECSYEFIRFKPWWRKKK